MTDRQDQSQTCRSSECHAEPETIDPVPPKFGPDEEWVKAYIEQFGEEPSFF